MYNKFKEIIMKKNIFMICILTILLSCFATHIATAWEEPSEEEIIEDYSSRYSHVTNETLREIAILYGIVRNIFDSGRDREMAELLLAFLRDEENWSIDVGNELSFIYRNVSEDDMVRIYNWEFESATGDTFHTIIQYRSESGTINAVQISGWGGYDEQIHPLGFRWGHGYGVGFKIEEQTYLIWAHARAGGFMSHASFVAVRLLDGRIEPYLAFNGNNHLGFMVGTQFGGIIEDFDIQFDEEPFLIRIFYNPHEINSRQPNNILDFAFNGTEFLGDYSRFNEIVNFRRY